MCVVVCLCVCVSVCVCHVFLSDIDLVLLLLEWENRVSLKTLRKDFHDLQLSPKCKESEEATQEKKKSGMFSVNYEINSKRLDPQTQRGPKATITANIHPAERGLWTRRRHRGPGPRVTSAFVSDVVSKRVFISFKKRKQLINECIVDWKDIENDNCWISDQNYSPSLREPFLHSPLQVQPSAMAETCGNSAFAWNFNLRNCIP